MRDTNDPIQDLLSTAKELRKKSANARLERDKEQQRFLREHERTQREIDAFIEACGAVACPIEFYALWLLNWFEDGGKISWASEKPFPTEKWLVPTQSTHMLIPTAYGAQAQHLLVFSTDSHSVSISDRPSSKWGDRAGWEWGHTEVLRLDLRDGQRVAQSNTSHIVTYPDVEALLQGGRAALERRMSLSKGSSRASFWQRINPAPKK